MAAARAGETAGVRSPVRTDMGDEGAEGVVFSKLFIMHDVRSSVLGMMLK